MAIGKELKSVLPLSMLSYFFVACWSFLVPLIQRQLGFSYFEIGLVVAVSTIASLATRLVMGRLADRFGADHTIKFSLLALSMSSFMVFVSYDLVSFTAASIFYLISTAMIYWTSMLAIGSERKQISLWLSLNNLGGFFGFAVATACSAIFDSRILFGITFIFPLFYLRSREIKVKVPSGNGRINKSLAILSVAGFFMVFHVSMWSSFLPIYLNDILPSTGTYLSTGLFLAFDSLFFTFVFYFSGKVDTKIKGAAMVTVTTVLFTLIVSAVPLLPLASFLLIFILLRNVLIAFRMVGIAEMIGQKRFGNFQTQFYSTFANSAVIAAPIVGGILSDTAGLDSIFYLSAPFGFISSLLFIL